MIANLAQTQQGHWWRIHFRGGQHTDKPSFQAPAEPELCLFLNSPPVSVLGLGLSPRRAKVVQHRLRAFRQSDHIFGRQWGGARL
jgi:hypothetical protein